MRKNVENPERGRGHEGCKRKHCTMQMLLREKNRTEEMIRESEAAKRASTNFDDILLNYEMQRHDERRLCRIGSAISRIQEHGNCEGVLLESLMPAYIIEEIKRPAPQPKPERKAL